MKKHIKILVFSLMIVMMSVLMNAGHLYAANNALSFNGAGQYVTVPYNSNLDMTANFTLEAWIYKNSSFPQNYWPGIIRKGNYYIVGAGLPGGSDKLRFGFYGDTEYVIDTQYDILNNQWVHFAGTYDGSILTTYINGVVDKTLTIAGGKTVGTDILNLHIGESSTYCFNGMIDEVRIWNVARLQSDIQANMYRTLAGTELNLVAYYNFDQTSGTSLPDLAGGDNNGTLTNMTGTTEWTAATWNYGYPYVTTGTASSITATTASVALTLVDPGIPATPAPTSGICYGTSAAPTSCVAGNSLTGLTSGTLYYARAYATNTSGTTYGSDITFTTLYAPVITGQNALSTNEDTALTINLGNLTVTDADSSYPTGFSLTVNSGTKTQIITADSGTWDDTADGGTTTITYTYQWQLADDASGKNLVSISGATDTSYTLTSADVQKYIRVQVTAKDDGVGTPASQSATAYSPYQKISITAPVIAQGTDISVSMDEDSTPLAWSTPTITATTAPGITLTWTLSTPAGHGTATVSGTGASPTITYAPAANYNGADSFTAQVSDGFGGTASIAVNVTINPINDPPVNTTAPGITGKMATGQILTANPGVWDDTIDTSVSGASTISYAYQWQLADDANGTNLADIAGATDSSYTLTTADVQKYFSVKVTATDTGVGLPDTQSATMTARLLGIQGRVYAADGTPIAGVWGNAWSETLSIGSGAYTDDTGYYIIYGLKAVSDADAADNGYTVDAVSPGGISQTYPSKAATGGSGIDFNLKAGFSVSGNVKDMNLNPVSGAKVYAASQAYPVQKTGTAFTDSQGNYTISGLEPASDYIVSVSASEYALQYYNKTSDMSKAAPVNLMLSDIQGIDFVLDKGLVIRGFVRANNNSPLPAGITVNAQSASLPKFGDAKTDAQGKYEIIGLDQNITDFIISVRQTGYVPAYYASSGTVLIREQADKVAPAAYSQAPERNIVLTTGFKISGLITFNGQGLSGITIETISPTTGERATVISASGDTLSLPKGSYDVIFRSTDYEDLHKTVVIADKDIPLNVSLIAKPL